MYVAHYAFCVACILRGCDYVNCFLYEYMDMDMERTLPCQVWRCPRLILTLIIPKP